MSAMGTGHIVIVPEHRTGSHGGCLLSDGKMDKAGYEILLKEFAGLLLKGPYQKHLFQERLFFLLGRFQSFLLPCLSMGVGVSSY
jgi:hypothetical protein